MRTLLLALALLAPPAVAGESVPNSTTLWFESGAAVDRKSVV